MVVLNDTRLAYEANEAHKQLELQNTNDRQRAKWIRDIGCYEENSLVVLKKATTSAKLIMLQYKLINRIVATNTYLKTIRAKDEDTCTFCKSEPETFVHLFWHCSKIKSFIAEIKLRILQP